ncbi:MAG: hypothetical protein H6835_08830 [Planctomycetes bacterium]|nr:hypothetical protein [Planctomycetota bacterium]
MTPQQRYATLHRAAESGLASDDLWAELAQVSVELGHREEAVRCIRKLHDPARREYVARRLAKALGLPTPEQALPAHHSDPRAARPTRHGGPGPHGRTRPDVAPATNATEAQPPATPGVLDHLLDAAQYLLHQHMPWLALTTMLAFPLVVGVGGFLTAGGSPLLLAAIAALPGLAVLAVVAAMGRSILLTSSEGVQDVPNLPEFGLLVHDARRFAFDAGLITLVFAGVPLGLFLVGAPLAVLLAGLAFGVVFAPLAFSLRTIRGDFRAIAPSILLRALPRAGLGYLAVAACTTLAFAPAAAVVLGTLGRPVWVQIAFAGPLCVLPVFATARLLGSWFDTRREALGYLLHNPQQTLRGGGAPVAEAAPQKPTPRALRKPAALEHFKAPALGKPNAAAAGAAGRARSTAAAAAADRARTATAQQRPAPRAIEGRRPAAAPSTQQTSKAARPPAAAPAPAPRRQPAPAVQGVPGVGGRTVVSGSERARHGAASRPRR